MKIFSDVLKDTTITTEAGNFVVNVDGVVDIPDDVAQQLIEDGMFSKLEKSESKPATTKTEKADEETKTDTKKSK